MSDFSKELFNTCYRRVMRKKIEEENLPSLDKGNYIIHSSETDLLGVPITICGVKE
jgi:hypothetical protein